MLGPIGLAQLIWNGQWPLAASILCVTNDVIWWLPFGLYLFDVRRSRYANPAVCT